ncbi:MAG: HAD family phosphatase [Planctomycetes bacterium]|nr:HAD family phosphatase [Planctomycetota bacterium]
MKDKFAVIWDMDGTLVDTAELHYRAWQELARQIDKPFTRADFAGTFGWRNPELIPRLFGEQYSVAEVEELAHCKELLYRDKAKLGVALLPGAATLLAGLQAAGFGQAIGSSAPRANLELILEITGSTRSFQAIVAMEDTPRGKPDPEVFLLAARKLQVAPERCLVFEDAPVGVQAAKAGGMRCIAVTFVGHHPRETLAAAGADRVVDSLETVSPADVRRLLG